ncbi:TM2 domain-containing protein [Rheinheimera gaetbuli]
MLQQAEVDAEEERLRQQAADLPDFQRQAFYQVLKQRLKDPDTYATLNWCFFAGLHHFYLGQWLRGLFNLMVSIVGVGMLFTHVWLLGLALLLGIALIEFYQLLRSQIIIQHWNNRIMRELLDSGDYLPG